MNANLVVSVVFVVACAVYGNPLIKVKQLKGLDDNLCRLKKNGHDNYGIVGCYSFKSLMKQKIFGKEAYKKTKATSETPLNQCITEAMENNYEIIGIQKIKKSIYCRKGNEQGWKPDELKKLNPNKCKKNVGSKKTIFIYQKSQNPATCSANNKTYNDGDEIIFHNVTHPILNAACTMCQCSAGNITGCAFRHCDIGLGSMLPELCDNWITKQEGVCCPHCACSNNGDTWVKHSNSGQCFECSCTNFHVQCTRTLCFSGCPGTTVPVPGKCCPKCILTSKPPSTTGPFFTIELTTTRAPPVFPPFPFHKKRDVVSRDEQFDDEESDEMEQ